MAFKERYYEKYDIFKVDKTEQQFQVVAHPVRRSDNYWEVVVRLIDPGYEGTLDISGCQIGDTTRFLGNAMPEMSEEGAESLTFFKFSQMLGSTYNQQQSRYIYLYE